MNLSAELTRTRPDYVVYAPKSLDGNDGGNEHFLVEPLPGGGLFAVWTQSSFEGEPDQRIVFATSADGGANWTPPRLLAGPDPAAGIGMASWAFPLVSKSGKIYVVYNRHVGLDDVYTHMTGRMACIRSDDSGKSWSAEATLPMPPSVWSNPDPKYPANWIVWQKPLRLSRGKYFTGFTRWIGPSVLKDNGVPGWLGAPSVVEFMRFENVDDDPLPGELRISWFMENERALRAHTPENPTVPCLQEPSIIPLPDGRLFAVMRSALGSPWWSASADAGENWSRPEPLRQSDDGPLLPHPLSPCPLYALDAENSFLLHHNHDGHVPWVEKFDHSHPRRPICLARGAFRPGARQPVWFSAPWMLMDNGGVPLLRNDFSMYASVTPTEDGLVLWYPDRKFFLLGRRLRRDLILNLPVKG